MKSRLEKKFKKLEQRLAGLERGQNSVALSSEAGEVVVMSSDGLNQLAHAAIGLSDYLRAVKRSERAQNRDGFG